MIDETLNGKPLHGFSQWSTPDAKFGHEVTLYQNGSWLNL
jgi:hypothetical protein